MSRPLFLLLSGALLALATVPSPAQIPLPEEKPIRIGRYPAVSPEGGRICFTYQGNLWVVPVGGGPATRLTASDAYDSNPRWSPDGKWIAFNSDREGGSQIFLIPSVGGAARQVTFHSVETTVHDWFPDNQSLLVTTSRETPRSSIYRLDAVTGRLKLLVTDESKCLFPSLSPDGKWIAYTRGALVDVIRKGYKGAANYDIYIAPVDRAAPPRELTDTDRNEMWPVWGADSSTVYYTSEREGLATLWKQSREGGKASQVVTEPADAIRYPTIARDGSVLAFECDNQICTVPASAGRTAPRVVPILCRTDERGPRTSHATYSGNNVSEFALSPDGKRVALVVRGDIFVAATDRSGEAWRLTDNPTRDGDLAWSPDGKTLVYSSNRDGGYRLYSVDVVSRTTKPLTQGGGIETTPAFSPDGKWLAFRRGPQTSLYLIRPDGTGEQLAARGPKVYEFKWSPDGKWLAFSREDEIRNEDVWIVPVTPMENAISVGTPLNISDHPGINDSIRWFADGSRLAFRSNRYRNRDIETINHQGKYALYTVSLDREKEKLQIGEDVVKPTEMPMAAKKGEVKLDPEEIERRAKQIVGVDEGIQSFEVSPDSRTIVVVARNMGRTDLWQVSADGGTLQRLTTNGEFAQGIEWAPDSSRFYYLSGGAVKWMNRGGSGSGTVDFTARMEIDRLVDYRAAFDEAWQILNDSFYDRTFHGVDWKAMSAKYRPLIDHATTRRDFNYLVTQMLGELNASHTGISTPGGRGGRNTGYLGVWLDEDYSGPGVKIKAVMKRSPADRPESRLEPGDHILAIDGTDVQPGTAYDRALQDKDGRTVVLLVNKMPVKEGARTVRIKPIGRAAWSELMYEKLIDEKREIARKASEGRIGYLHVADMGDTARNRFERELFSIGQRTDALVLDLRGNNGGDTHDSLLRILARNRHYFTFAPRLETPFPQPERAVVKPIILLINEFSLSDAEVFANGFRELGLGKIIGTPTMGWIIFTSGRPLIDGSMFRVPHLGCYTLDGRDMENWGVPPDIRVTHSPADYLAGRDPQLERAVQELLRHDKLKKR